MKQAAASGLAQFNAFLLEYKPDGRRVFALLEGRDDPSFYRRLVELRLPAGYALRLVRCGNRRAVIDAIARFVARFPPDPRVIAFVDKDHSDLCSDNAVITYEYAFQTDFYSVENYLCDPTVIRRHCVESLGLPDDDDVCSKIEGQFRVSLSRFHSIMRRPMAWIVAARRRRLSVNLSNIDTSKLVNLDDDLLPQPTVAEAEVDRYLEKVTVGVAPAPEVPPTEVAAAADELAKLPPKLWLRGKQELWMTATFIARLAPALKSKGLRAGGKVAVSPANALEVLAPKCDIPPSLDTFLGSTFRRLPVLGAPA